MMEPAIAASKPIVNRIDETYENRSEICFSTNCLYSQTPPQKVTPYTIAAMVGLMPTRGMYLQTKNKLVARITAHCTRVPIRSVNFLSIMGANKIRWTMLGLMEYASDILSKNSNG